MLTSRTYYGLTPKYPHARALQSHVDVANAIQRGISAAAGEAMLKMMDQATEEMVQIWTEGCTLVTAGTGR